MKIRCFILTQNLNVKKNATQRIIERQLVLVLDVCKAKNAHIKIEYSCHANTFNLRAALTIVNCVALNRPKMKTTSK